MLGNRDSKTVIDTKCYRKTVMSERKGEAFEADLALSVKLTDTTRQHRVRFASSCLLLVSLYLYHCYRQMVKAPFRPNSYYR